MPGQLSPRIPPVLVGHGIAPLSPAENSSGSLLGRCVRSRKVILEPVGCKLRDVFERARFLEQVRGTRHDGQILDRSAKASEGLPATGTSGLGRVWVCGLMRVP